jgi:succinate-acetate transporter protein
MINKRYSPFTIGVLSYSIGILPYAADLLGWMPEALRPAMWLNVLVFAGIGQVLTALLCAQFVFQPTAALFFLFGLHWTLVSLIFFFQVDQVANSQLIVVPSFLLVTLVVLAMTPRTLYAFSTSFLMYTLSGLALGSNLIALWTGTNLLPWAGGLFMISAFLGVYIATSQLVFDTTGKRILPLGRPLLTLNAIQDPAKL